MTVITPVLLPAVIAGVVWLVSYRLWDRHAPAENGHWGGAIAFGFGYLAGHAALVSWPGFPPSSAEEWLAALGVPLAIIAANERFWGAKPWAAWPVRVICLMLFIWPQSLSLFEYRWSPRETMLWLGGMAVAVSILWELTERLARRRAGFMLPAILWLVTVAASIALVWTGSAMLGQLAGALAAILGAAVVLTLWAPKLSLAFGAVSMWVLLFTGLLWQGRFYSELGLGSAVCFLAAPVFAWAGEWPALQAKPAWTRGAVRLIAVLIPLAIGLFLAWRYWSTLPEEYVY